MSRLQELREKRERAADEANALNNKYPGDTPMPKAEVERLDRLLDSIEAMDREIDDLGRRRQEAGAAYAGSWTVDGVDVPVLRGAAEIRRHYGARREQGSMHRGDMSLAAFVRGMAGLPTTDSIRASLSEGTDSAGGHLVPFKLMPDVLEAMAPASALLSAGAGIIPVDQGSKSLTQAAIDTLPSAAWRAENGNVTESEPTFRAVVAQPQSLSFFFKISRELLADAANLQPALVTAISQAFAKELDRAGLRGTGTAPEPRGILNTAGVLAVANGANGASLATTKYGNLFSAVQKVLEVDGPMPMACIMSPRSRIVLAGLADSTGQALQPPPMIEPLKQLVSTQIPNNLTVGSSSDCSEIYVGDFSRMAFMLRERLSIMRADQLFATTGQIGFVCHVRADVMIQYPKAFAVVTGVRP